MITSRTPTEIQTILLDEGFQSLDCFDRSKLMGHYPVAGFGFDDFSGTLAAAVSHVPPAMRAP